MKDYEQQIYDFILKEPRSRKEIIDFVKNQDITSYRTADKVIKGFVKNGLLTFVKINRQKTYSVCKDKRLQAVAEKIAAYDIHDHRIKRIAEYWDRFVTGDVIRTDEEVSAEVKSFVSGEWYTTVVKKNGETFCSCLGFHDVPCSHILALAIKQNVIEWLP